MKKIMLLAITALILFCIVPISNIQAMQHRPDRNNTRALDQPYIVRSIFHQKQLRNIITALDNPLFTEELPSNHISEMTGSLLAKGNEHNTSTANNDEQQKEKNIWPKDAWGDAEYPEEVYDSTVDKKNDRHKQESPWPKDEWGDAEYPED